jgi:hypothetical protein
MVEGLEPGSRLSKEAALASTGGLLFDWFPVVEGHEPSSRLEGSLSSWGGGLIN